MPAGEGVYVGELDPFFGGIEGRKMNGEPIHVTDEAFERTVLESEIPTLVDFWAPWCGPCLMVAPILDKLADEYAGKLQVAKVNTDEQPKWAMQFGVQGIPTMLLVANGKVVHRQVGALPEPYLRDMVEEFLSAVEEASNGNATGASSADSQPEQASDAGSGASEADAVPMADRGQD